MRFCTTHRACESYPASRACEVGIHLEADHDALPNCTLVDALIVPKEDGEWPEWAQDEAREWAIYFTKPAGFLVLPEDLFDNLRGLYEAAKETP